MRVGLTASVAALKAIAEPTRLRILALLAEGERRELMASYRQQLTQQIETVARTAKHDAGAERTFEAVQPPAVPSAASRSNAPYRGRAAPPAVPSTALLCRAPVRNAVLCRASRALPRFASPGRASPRCHRQPRFA